MQNTPDRIAATEDEVLFPAYPGAYRIAPAGQWSQNRIAGDRTVTHIAAAGHHVCWLVDSSGTDLQCFDLIDGEMGPITRPIGGSPSRIGIAADADRFYAAYQCGSSNSVVNFVSLPWDALFNPAPADAAVAIVACPIPL